MLPGRHFSCAFGYTLNICKKGLFKAVEFRKNMVYY